MAGSGRLRIVARSDPGRVRTNNEDCVDYDASLGIAVLADGMGGQNAGEVASRVAVSALMRDLRAGAPPDGAALAQAFELANREVRALASLRREYDGMGTTMVAVVVTGAEAVVAHAGDSRAYAFGAGGLRRLTRDHSLVGYLVESGVLTEEQARRAPNRHIVTRAVGMLESVPCDVTTTAFEADDLLLLCSDGLTDMIDDHAIATLCARIGDPAELADALIEAALAYGGLDNVSVIAIKHG